MFSKFSKSPVQNQDFIWVAHYMDNTFLSEFNFDNKQENSFYSIDRTKLIRFGLVGYGLNFYYEVLGGTFKIAGQTYDFSYKTGDQEYHLTCRPMTMYNDIITYKDAEANLNIHHGGISGSSITQYSLGYKHKLEIDDVTFNFKPIFSLPYGQPSYFNLRLVADRDMSGKFCIRKNGLVLEELHAPIQANIANELNWQVIV